MDALNTAKYELCLRLGDSALMLGNRLAEWCGHAHIIEEDIALTNISLDYIGLTRNLLTYAAQIQNLGKTEDDLAYLRDAHQYRNALLTEQPNGHFGNTIMRQFLYDAFSQLYYKALFESSDETLRGIAGKAQKETEYHYRHSSEWVLRIGDGTQESHEKAQEALDELWMFTADLFDTDEHYELLLKNKIVPDMGKIKEQWTKNVASVLKEATLGIPESTYMQKGSLQGIHTEHLGYMLTEMQFLQRAYPNSNW